VTVLDISDEQFKAWFNTSLSKDNALIAQGLAAAVAHLSARTGRNLTVVDDDTADVTFNLTPRSHCTDVLWIQDLATITSVVENGVTLVAGTDYVAKPDGHLDEATGQWKPYDRLYRLDSWWYWDGRKNTVVVTGKPGWSTVHPLAREAVKVLAADWLSMRESRNGIVSATADGFSIGARSNPLVEQAVSALAGPQSFGIA